MTVCNYLSFDVSHVELLQETPKIDEGPPRPEFLPKTTKPNIEKAKIDVGPNVAAAPLNPDVVVDGGNGGDSLAKEETPNVPSNTPSANGTLRHGNGYSVGGDAAVGYNGGSGGGGYARDFGTSGGSGRTGAFGGGGGGGGGGASGGGGDGEGGGKGGDYGGGGPGGDKGGDEESW